MFKSCLFKMAVIVMTVKFCTIHHYSSLEENSETCWICVVLWTDTKINWTLCKLWHSCFKQQHEYKLSSSIPHFVLAWQQLIISLGKSILQVPDTGTRVLDNTKPFLSSSIVSLWITTAHSKERKYHIFRQYWYTKSVPVFTNTGTFQYLGPEVYFFLSLILADGIFDFFLLYS